MDQHIHELALRYYETLDSAHSLTCAILLRYSEWDQLATRETDPNVYICPYTYRRDAYANDLLRKLEQLPTSINKREVALQKWWEAEKKCFRTNRFLWDCFNGDMPSTRVITFLSRVKKTISEILGSCPSEIDLKFGPGATFQRRGARCTIPDKISYQPEMTGNAWLFHREYHESAWYRAISDTLFLDDKPRRTEVPYVRGNRFVTVPKDGKTDRAIAIEPSLNISIQLGIGSYIRKKLNRLGLLTEYSQELHREYARKGSIDDNLATIDLSSASDTVAYELVRAVMPDDWFELLDAVRSPLTVMPDGKAVKLEKFSSMGNGYTFELETLIFYAICKQCTKEDFLSVYGDDIIVPVRCAPDVVGLLETFGFTLNRRKTFLLGYFRESCGGDFFNGVPVRAIFLKDLSSWDVPDLFTLHNLFKRVGAQTCCDYILSLIPSRYRNLMGPSDLGDIILHGEGKPTLEDSILYYRCLKLLPFKYPIERWDANTACASILYGVLSDGVSPRDPPVSYRLGWVARS